MTRAAWLSVATALLLSSCATTGVDRLPPVTAPATSPLVPAHARASAAFARCVEAEREHDPTFPAVAAAGSGALTLAVAGAAFGAAVLVPDHTGGLVAAGLAVVTGALGGITVHLVEQTLGDDERHRVLGLLLHDADERATTALVDEDAAGLDRLARHLDEDCRAAAAARGADAAVRVLGDLDHYRRDEAAAAKETSQLKSQAARGAAAVARADLTALTHQHHVVEALAGPMRAGGVTVLLAGSDVTIGLPAGAGNALLLQVGDALVDAQEAPALVRARAPELGAAAQRALEVARVLGVAATAAVVGPAGLEIVVKAP